MMTRNIRNTLVITVVCLLGWAAIVLATPQNRSSLESRVRTLERTCRSLQSSLKNEIHRSNARDALMAKWFDGYHNHGSGWWHRNAIRRTQ